MKRLSSTILTLILLLIVSSTALAGNIPGGRIAGHIATGRAAGNIPVGRATSAVISPSLPTGTSRFDVEGTLAGSFVGLIRMLLDSGALL